MPTENRHCEPQTPTAVRTLGKSERAVTLIKIEIPSNGKQYRSHTNELERPGGTGVFKFRIRNTITTVADKPKLRQSLRFGFPTYTTIVARYCAQGTQAQHAPKSQRRKHKIGRASWSMQYSVHDVWLQGHQQMGDGRNVPASSIVPDTPR